jgi:hypothetical protein
MSWRRTGAAASIIAGRRLPHTSIGLLRSACVIPLHSRAVERRGPFSALPHEVRVAIAGTVQSSVATGFGAAFAVAALIAILFSAAS